MIVETGNSQSTHSSERLAERFSTALLSWWEYKLKLEFSNEKIV